MDLIIYYFIILLYPRTYLRFNLPSEAIVLAHFIERAKKNYGIVQVGAVAKRMLRLIKSPRLIVFMGTIGFENLMF